MYPAEQNDSSLEFSRSFMVLLLGGAIIWITLAIWTYRDARSKNMNPAFWFIVVILLNFFGLVAYLIVVNKNRTKEQGVWDAIPLAIPFDEHMNTYPDQYPQDYEIDDGEISEQNESQEEDIEQ